MGDDLEDRLRQHWDRPVQVSADAGGRVLALAGRRRRRRIAVLGATVVALAAAGGVAAAVVPGGSGTQGVTVALSPPQCVPGAGAGFPSTAPLAIDAAGVGWVSGGNNVETLRHTDDGGATLQDVGPAAYAESFPDSCSARLLIGGDNGGGRTDFVVRATDDGGRTWRSTDLGVHADSDDALAFTDDQHGIAVFGDLVHDVWSSEIYHTADGGRTWQHVADEPFTGRATMVTADLVFVTDRGGTGVYRSADGGRTWTRTTIPPANSLAPVVFTSPTRGISSGAGSAPLQATSDGGRTWSPLAAIPTGGQHGIAFGYMPVAAISSNDLIAVFNGLLARSTDGGQHWRLTTMQSGPAAGPVPHLNAINTIDFTSSTQGWALTHVFTVGGAATDPSAQPAGLPPDLLLHTTDGGQHWTTMNYLGPDTSTSTQPVVVPPPATAPACLASALSVRPAGGATTSDVAFEIDNNGPTCSFPTRPPITVAFTSGPTRPLQATPIGTSARQSSIVVPAGQAATFTLTEPICSSDTGGPPPTEGSIAGFSINYDGHVFSVARNGPYIECPLQFQIFATARTG